MTAPVAPSSPPSGSGQKAPWTILEVLKWTTARFAERGLTSPRLDAELLAADALGMTRVALYTQFDRPLEAGELAALRQRVQRRQAGEPVAYITGHKEFWSLDLLVDGRVLVPRPDTETVVEEALARLPAGAPARIADVATGSGAIALALGKERPDAVVVATDLSAAALAVAAANAERLGQTPRLLPGDLLAPLLPLVEAEGPFDVVTANLPYVPSAEIPTLTAEVQSEPRLALDGGDDGLAIVRRLVGTVAAVLRPGGAVVMEIGAGQAAEVMALCRAVGLVEPRTRRDLGGVERVVAARRPEGA
jgi:release factor glutamine methyltransferase